MKIIYLYAILVLIFSTNSLAGTEDLYDFLWLDPDKSVYVLQNKIHTKKGRFYSEINLSNTFNSSFTNGLGYNIKIGHYFSETFAIEMSTSSFNNTFNEDFKSIKKVNDTEPFIRYYNEIKDINIVYAPFYGKINTFNKIIYFDWYLTIGIGEMITSSNKDTVGDKNTDTVFKEERFTTTETGTGVKIYLAPKIYINAEIESHIIHTKDPGQLNYDYKNYQNYNLGLGILY